MKITNVRIEHPKDMFGGRSKVIGTVGGSEKTIVQFFCDELSFSPSEFEGLTEREASDLFHKRDVAYLQS